MHENDKSSLIPDYCNDRLEPEEKALFEKLLEEDPALEEEYLEFKEFQELYRRADPEEPPPSAPLFDRIASQTGLRQEQRQEQRLEQANADRGTVEPQPGGSIPKTRKTGPFPDMWSRFCDWFRESLGLPWGLVAVQAVVLVVLLSPAVREVPRNPAGNNSYLTLSDSDQAATEGPHRINVVFTPSAREAEIRELLQTVDGSVTGGPSREGRYVVSIPKSDDLATAVSRLQGSEIVVFAEPFN